MSIEVIISNLYNNMLFGGNRLLIAFVLIAAVVTVNCLIILKTYKSNKITKVLLFFENIALVFAIVVIWAVVVLITDDLGADFSSLATGLAAKYKFVALWSLLSLTISTIIMAIRAIRAQIKSK